MPIGVTAGSPARSRWLRTAYSRSATSSGSSFSATRSPSTTRKRTRWRDGPIGRTRNWRLAGHWASGSSHGRSRSAPARRSRSAGKRRKALASGSMSRVVARPTARSRTTTCGPQVGLGQDEPARCRAGPESDGRGATGSIRFGRIAGSRRDVDRADALAVARQRGRKAALRVGLEEDDRGRVVRAPGRPPLPADPGGRAEELVSRAAASTRAGASRRG